jgi:hypothetical protein
MRPQAYHELRQLATELASRSDGARRSGPLYTFDCPAVGLILRDEEGRNSYDNTPVNADTFAETGGDGVHFSLLLIEDGRTIENAPIVMTVPMAFERANHIVGANLVEFLSLGCRYGYFKLEQLAYDRSGTIDPDAHLLEDIIRRVGLRPWVDVRERLNDLDEQYGPVVQLGPWVEDL